MSFENSKEPEFQDMPQPSSRDLLWLSVTSVLVYLGLTILIFYFFRERGADQAFAHGLTVSSQLLVGILSGGAAAGIIGYSIKKKPIRRVLHDFYIVELIANTRLSTFDRLQLSLFAGAGEELLFRGAIQPLLGIWFTSLIFVALHGYFKFNSFGHFLFGAMMFGLSMLLGYLFEYAGLVAAMSAHATYDIIVLRLVQQKE